MNKKVNKKHRFYVVQRHSSLFDDAVNWQNISWLDLPEDKHESENLSGLVLLLCNFGTEVLFLSQIWSLSMYLKGKYIYTSLCQCLLERTLKTGTLWKGSRHSIWSPNVPFTVILNLRKIIFLFPIQSNYKKKLFCWFSRTIDAVYVRAYALGKWMK